MCTKKSPSYFLPQRTSNHYIIVKLNNSHQNLNFDTATHTKKGIGKNTFPCYYTIFTCFFVRDEVYFKVEIENNPV